MRWWQAMVVASGSAVASIAVYDRLPERVAIHWGVSGAANGWATRPIGAFGMPVAMLVLAALMYAAPRVDAYREAYDRAPDALGRVHGIVLTALLAAHVLVLAVAIGVDVPTRRLLPAASGLLVLAIGNELPRVRRNRFVGIRTPWAMGDDQQFRRTQRVSGYAFVLAGLSFLAASAMPEPWISTTVGVAIGAMVLGAVALAAQKSMHG